MTKELRSRARFLMELVADFNDKYKDMRASFQMDDDSINIDILKDRDFLMDKYYFFKDLTEETVYEAYKQMNAATVKSTVSDDAPKMDNVTEE